MFNNDNIPQSMRFTYAESFDSYRDLNLIVGHFQKPIVPQMQESIEDVPGMYGSIYTGTNFGELTFNIPVTIMAYDETTYNLSLENIRSVLINNDFDRGKEYPIVFGDRPEVTYYVHLVNISTPTFLTTSDWQAKATITFSASQPCGYLSQENIEMFGGFPIYPKGSAPTHPTYTMLLYKDVTQLGFTNMTAGGGYVATGYQVDADNTDDEGNKIQDKEPLTTDEPATNLEFWDYGDKAKDLESSIDPDDLIDGQMGEYEDWGIGVATHQVKDQNQKQPNAMHTTLNYGDPTKHRSNSDGEATNFYGPLAVHQDFNNPTYDWQLMINLRNVKNMKNFNGAIAMGHLDIYLLGENHQRQGKIYIHNLEHGRMPRLGVQLGTKSNHVDLIDPINGGTIGPGTIEGADHKQHNMWINGHNSTSIVYDIQYYKEAVGNAKPKTKRKRKPSKRRRKHFRMLLGTGLSVQAHYAALSKSSLLDKNNLYSLRKRKIKKRIKRRPMKAKKIKRRKKKKGGRKRSPKPNNKKARTKYRKKVKKKWSAGSDVPSDYKGGSPRGTHWVNKHKWNQHKEIDFNNTDIFNNFDGNFFLRKVGKNFKMWIQVEDSAYGADPNPICEYCYSDDDGEFNFPLTSVAAHFTKHNTILDNSQFPHVYTQVHMGVGALKYWSIIDGGNTDPKKPKVIAHQGELVTIDTDKMKVYKSDGQDLTKITSFASTFPPIIGGIPNNVNFYPTPGIDCDVTCTYIPMIK